ncbi:MAG: gamma-glutamylcyclotransferase family protein [Hyphomicrobiaceae bacterium]|nr:gamma-glutamylcyclotransferase family protein [Hyphomicrobiaceae bacterium]
MTAAPRTLFVYGTLMSSASGSLGADERARLHASARRLGSGRMAGHLYDLGDYPGLLPLVRGSHPLVTMEYVRGEVLVLTDPEAVFAWLDVYEGIVAGQPDPEYRREAHEIDVMLGDAGGHSLTPSSTMLCWVYVLARPVAGLAPVEGGTWIASTPRAISRDGV